MDLIYSEGLYKGEFEPGQFKKWWPGGYRDNRFATRGYDANTLLAEVDDLGVSGDALEIGPGGLFWTEKFSSRFKKIYAVDVAANNKKKPANCKFIVTDNSRPYALSEIENETIDFVYSIDVFCHFGFTAKDEYLSSINRVMKVGGKGIIMFADWKNFTDSKRGIPNAKEVYLHHHEGGWFYDDLDLVQELLNKNNLTFVKNCFPDSRDNVVIFEKR